MEYDSQNKCFPLGDGKSIAAVFELGDVPSEARPDEYLIQLQEGLQGVFQDVFPPYFDDESPWIIQFFLVAVAAADIPKDSTDRVPTNFPSINSREVVTKFS